MTNIRPATQLTVIKWRISTHKKPCRPAYKPSKLIGAPQNGHGARFGFS
jgi:hypothetical protein